MTGEVTDAVQCSAHPFHSVRGPCRPPFMRAALHGERWDSRRLQRAESCLQEEEGGVAWQAVERAEVGGERGGEGRPLVGGEEGLRGGNGRRGGTDRRMKKKRSKVGELKIGKIRCQRQDDSIQNDH